MSKENISLDLEQKIHILVDIIINKDKINLVNVLAIFEFENLIFD